MRNAFYAQSGGVTAVINATACGLIETARRFSLQMGTVFAGCDGIVGGLTNQLIDTAQLTTDQLASLRHRPGGVFGSSRYPLLDRVSHRDQYLRLLDVFAANDIAYFFYNGGNGSMQTAHEVASFAKEAGYSLAVIGIPKTIDNDLVHTDTCPGFGSAAKYVATSVREVSLDVAAMCRSSTQVYVFEVMGRHAGWLAAAAGLAAQCADNGPHLILFPEVPFNEVDFLARVKATVERVGYCVVVAAEGICSPTGEAIACDIGGVHSHGEPGRVGSALVKRIHEVLGYKLHWTLVDYLQRTAGHLVSATDQEQAYALGAAAVEKALAGESNIMLTLERLSDEPYRWLIGQVALNQVAGAERKMPKAFIDETGYHITEACRRYLLPLIAGESWPPYRDGLPDYPRIDLKISSAV
ncbi:MAG: hypothetical protein RIR18_2304 [Pseudomonadota bacterium]